MEFDDVRAFVSVADAGSVSLAARNLNITQPAVTRRLPRLEAHSARRWSTGIRTQSFWNVPNSVAIDDAHQFAHRSHGRSEIAGVLERSRPY
jgi:hypothetical protein